jgi:hypothetical protein
VVQRSFFVRIPFASRLFLARICNFAQRPAQRVREARLMRGYQHFLLKGLWTNRPQTLQLIDVTGFSRRACSVAAQLVI